MNKVRVGIKRRFCGPEHYDAHCDPQAKKQCTDPSKRECGGYAPHGGKTGSLCRGCFARKTKSNAR